MPVKGNIEMEVDNYTKIGTEKLNRSHLSVVCPIVKRVRNGLTYCYESYRMDELWEGINVCLQSSL